ncbi:putative leader peptide [Pseudonocardia yuanmonensis]
MRLTDRFAYRRHVDLGRVASALCSAPVN